MRFAGNNEPSAAWVTRAAFGGLNADASARPDDEMGALLAPTPDGNAGARRGGAASVATDCAGARNWAIAARGSLGTMLVGVTVTG
jgi:hypothetical protein